MPVNLTGRSFLTLLDFSKEEIQYLVDYAIELKRERKRGEYPKRLANKNFAMVFLKPSCRTRLSFVTAAVEEGAHLEIFSAEDIRFGIKESIKDVARVFGRLFHGLAFRGFSQKHVEDIAACAGIPVWNGLSDKYHPTQVLADLMTLEEEFGRLAGLKLAFVGDGRNNMVNSLMIASSKLGIDFRVVAPKELHPSNEILNEFSEKLGKDIRSNVRFMEDITEGVTGCDAVYGDIWVSMGEEHLVQTRIAQLKPYKITKKVIESTKNGKAIYLHCMPALHDGSTEFEKKYADISDVDSDVFESERSRVFDQAENRMHTIKALMLTTLGKNVKN